MTLWIVLAILGYVFFGHCVYMFAEFIDHDQEPAGVVIWLLCALLWPVIVISIGIIRTVWKIFR